MIARSTTNTYYLMIRALRESTRQPAVEIGNIFIPMFFFAITVGAIGEVAGRAFGVTNYVGFWEDQAPAQTGQTWRAVWVSPDFSSTQASREIVLK